LRNRRGRRHGCSTQPTIVWSSDPDDVTRSWPRCWVAASADRFGHFDVVARNGVSLDFADAEGPVKPQHYAFLILRRLTLFSGRAASEGRHWAD
jgi:hypothetical protein